jgi:hypothetical protein
MTRHQVLLALLILWSSAVNANDSAKKPAVDSNAKTTATVDSKRSSEREWLDATGKHRTRATLVSIDGAVARFRRPDGRAANMTIAKLSAADQQYIQAWRQAEAAGGFAQFGKSFTDTIATWPMQTFDLKGSIANGLSDAKGTIAPPLPANAVYVRVSEELLQRQLTREITRQLPVAENILGTNTYGHAHVVGKPTIFLLRGEKHGLAELRFIGHVHSRTTGYNGPVRIHSHSDTAFSAAARLTLTPAKLTASSVRTRAKTNSTIDDMTTSLPGLRGRIALAIARRRAPRQLPIAEEIAAERAAKKISREFDQIVADRVEKISKAATAQLLAMRGDEKDAKQTPRMRISTTNDYLQVVAVWPDAAPWASEPPRLAHRPDVEVHVHRAAVNTALAEINTSSSAQPAILPIWLSRWAMNVALPRIGNAATGMFNGRPQLDVAWSDDRQWLQVSWHGQNGARPTTPGAKPIQFAQQPAAAGSNGGRRVATSPRTTPR